MKSFIIAFALMSTGVPANERDFVAGHCEGIAEHVNFDKTRVDCLTDAMAWEYDYASNWKASIGQALHYALQTGRKPGIRLILRRSSDERYVTKLKRLIVAYRLNIEVEVITR